MFTGYSATVLQVTKSHPRFTELTNRDAIEGTCPGDPGRDRYDIPQEEVMAIGDGYNDMDMIEWAGMGSGNGDRASVSAGCGPDSVAAS